MRKNRSMRGAALLLALTLITSCFVGSTFAKYITKGEATDTARVAKWGVEVTTNSGSAFAKEYPTSIDGETGLAVKADELVVAPGTNSTEANSDLTFEIKGTPEVKSKVEIAFDAISDIHAGPGYYPIVFTLQGWDNDTGVWVDKETGTLAEIKEYFDDNYPMTVEPGVALDAKFKLTWKWDFENSGMVNGTIVQPEHQDDYDTALGNVIATQTEPGETTIQFKTNPSMKVNTKLAYGMTITVTQVD